MANCSKCGKVLPNDALYCSACGSPIGELVQEEFAVSSDNLIERVKELIREGNITRIVVKDEKGKQLLEIPMTVGIIGIFLAPWLAALGVIAAIATKCTIIVERRK